MAVPIGATAGVDLVVADEDTADRLGSGAVPVLATSRVVALCDEASAQAVRVHLGDGETTVGMRIQLDHVAPVAVGTKVRAEATVERIEGRRVTFTVNVSNDAGLVAAGRVTRVVVDAGQFTERAR